MKNRVYDTRRIAIIGMLIAAAYVAVAVCRIPITPLPFLKYEPKDIIIVLGGFILGPLSSLIISVVVSLIEMITISETGVIGLIMNVLGSCSFACTAALIYKKKKTLGGAIIGIVAGVLCMTGVMILWNYLITPLYMKISREEVAALILPIFLPFNLIKAGLNGAFTMLLYKPVVSGLRKARLLPESEVERKSSYLGIAIVSLVLIATFVLLALVLRGTI